MIAMDKHEEALAELYGFVVSEQGDRFVVTDPKLPKKTKFIGGNLYSLMLEAVNERKRLKIEAPVQKIEIVPPPDNNVVSANFGGKKKLITPTPNPAPPPKAAAVPTKGNKLYLIKQMLLANPKSTVAEITTALKDHGFTTSTSTISTVRSDFLHSMRVIKDMNRWREC